MEDLGSSSWADGVGRAKIKRACRSPQSDKTASVTVLGRGGCDTNRSRVAYRSVSMAWTVAYDELTETRIHKEVKGGARWNPYFSQPAKGTRLPQAFLVENTPHRVLRTHYHDVDQFQVIVSGHGTLGKHAVRPYSVHFARAHTPYGPITA